MTSRAEHERVREPQVQVIGGRVPPRRCQVGVDVLHEGQVRMRRRVMQAMRRSPALELPVQKRERDVHVQPYEEACRQK